MSEPYEEGSPANKLTWPALQDRIKNSYPDMSKRLQQVAAYVLENQRLVAFDTIAVLSEQMKVPPSTLIRFASALDLSGFNELKNILKEDMLTHTPNYSNRIRMMKGSEHWKTDELINRFAKANRDALRHLEESTSPESVNKGVKLLAEARNIFVLGNGRAHTVATYLHYSLNHIDKKVFLISGAGGMFKEQMSNVERNDVLIAISFSPYSSNTCQLAAEAANRGVTVISITDSPVSPLANISQLAFIVQEAHIDSFRSLSASLLLSQVITIALADYDD